MNRKYLKWALGMLALVIALAGSVLLSLAVGEVSFRATELFAILQGDHDLAYVVLTKLRLPRIWLGFSVGGALSLAGVILQGIYRNPLVEPYTLGISGGAALGVALVIVCGLPLAVGSYVLPVAGFLGALATVFLVYFLSVWRDGFNINRMLLIGVMISFMASSAMMFLLATTTVENLNGIIFWVMGSLDEPDILLIRLVFVAAVVCLLVAYAFVHPLNAMRLGEEKARHLGVNTAVSIQVLFVASSLLTGVCVAITGVIGFVGLVIPHLLRMLAGSDYRVLLITSFLGGGAFVILSDIVARSVIAPNELPIGVITGLLGGLVFIIVLIRKN